MRSETRYLSQKQTHLKHSQSKERISNVTTDSETLRLSDFSQDPRQEGNLVNFERSLQYKKFFQQKVHQQQITPVLHKKAINWLITFCWTRSYSEQVLWYAVGYFYSYSSARLIQKDRLSLILISAINVANKLFQPENVMGFHTMKSLLNNVWKVDDFRTVEGEILDIFDFDLYFPTVLGDVSTIDRPEEQKAKILFLAQSLFMNSYEPALNDLILEDLVFLITEPECEHELLAEIKKLFKSPKFMEIIKQKYASKFNIDEFLEKLLGKN